MSEASSSDPRCGAPLGHDHEMFEIVYNADGGSTASGDTGGGGTQEAMTARMVWDDECMHTQPATTSNVVLTVIVHVVILRFGLWKSAARWRLRRLRWQLKCHNCVRQSLDGYAPPTCAVRSTTVEQVDECPPPTHSHIPTPRTANGITRMSAFLHTGAVTKN